MKTIMQNGAKANKYLERLPKIYLVGCWARWGTRCFYNSMKTDKRGVPLVWEYYDGNGTCDIWRLTPIDLTTSGVVLAWTDCQEHAMEAVKALNQKRVEQEGER